MTATFTPRPYQHAMLSHALDVPRCALWAGMGLGKSVATLTALDALELTEPGPALVLAPLRVARSTWPDEAAKWSHLRNVEVSPVVGTPEARKAALDKLELSPEQMVGVTIIRRAIEEPLRQIAANAGHEASVVVNEVRKAKGGNGFNARTEVYEDLLKAGVIDPAKVVRTALQNAGSVAGLMLTTQALIAEEPEKDDGGAAAAAGMGGMGF